MNIEEQQYLDLLTKIMDQGNVKDNRTGVVTKSIFGGQMRFSLKNGQFPLLTTKKLHTKSIIHELLWIINGDTNVKYLQDNGVRIWNEWSDENGSLGPIYGHQWRKWPNYVKKETFCQTKDDGGGVCVDNFENEPIDQLLWAQERLRTNPDCRRIIVSAWNPADLPKMSLAPCHCFFQFYTHEMTIKERIRIAHENKITGFNEEKEDIQEFLNKNNIPKRYLSCQLYQRSCDSFLGVPFNIASYALLTCMMAQTVNMLPYEFIWTGGDIHIYENHEEQVKEQTSRKPFNFPNIKINSEKKEITDFTFEDFEIIDYQSHPSIKGKVAV